MSDLSIFVDESGDFGAYKAYAPYYLFTLVFHEQSRDIRPQLHHLEKALAEIGFDSSHCFHTGPIIRREEDYR